MNALIEEQVENVVNLRFSADCYHLDYRTMDELEIVDIEEEASQQRERANIEQALVLKTKLEALETITFDLQDFADYLNLGRLDMPYVDTYHYLLQLIFADWWTVLKVFLKGLQALANRRISIVLRVVWRYLIYPYTREDALTVIPAVPLGKEDDVLKVCAALLKPFQDGVD
ncbi:hypothetical protein CLAFUW4_10689 [Fulvia fulva]|nr:hypothetical protein CLAFUR4_10694 [Fulvia fulva]WPV19612.1 hypothetical protein CLAFUW4_10689 [Fulvia fulva]WPV34388.1 hypothetical protein CLAFUW7_10691 [Fulvia fulva]